MTLLECADQTRTVPFVLFVLGVLALGFWIKRRYALTIAQTMRVLAGWSQPGVVLPAKVIVVTVFGLIAFGAIWAGLIVACKG